MAHKAHAHQLWTRESVYTINIDKKIFGSTILKLISFFAWSFKNSVKFMKFIIGSEIKLSHITKYIIILLLLSG